MQLLVVLALLLDVALDGVFVARFAHGVDVEATCPELASPEHLADLGVTVEEFPSRDALDGTSDLGGRKGGNALDEEVNMVFIRSDLDEGDFVALGDAPADVFQRFLDRFGKNFLVVFDRADQVVEKKRDVMGFMHVPTHGSTLPLRCRKETGQAPGNQTRGD